MNSLQILGRLTRDPEIKNANGKSVCQFAIAVNRNKEEADFFECVAWEKTAETISQYVKKGQRILIDGRLQQDRWKDQQSGENRSTVKIILNRFDFIEAAEQQNAQQQPQAQAPMQAPYPVPPMGAPGAYGQPPMQSPPMPYPGQYPQQQMPQQQAPGFMPHLPAGRPPMPQQQQQAPQQSYWLGDAPQNAPASTPGYGNYGYQVPYDKNNPPF